MRSPVSVVVAEIVMQQVEERALETCRQTIPLWLRYVDDTFIYLFIFLGILAFVIAGGLISLIFNRG